MNKIELVFFWTTEVFEPDLDQFTSESHHEVVTKFVPFILILNLWCLEMFDATSDQMKDDL